MKKRLFSRFRSARDSIKAIGEQKLSRSQLAGIIRERKLYRQISKNLRELEGSWPRSLRRQLLLLQGQPRNDDSTK
jgi:hypothetical protein